MAAFSVDLGPPRAELLRNPEMFKQAACLLLRREVLEALAEPTEIAWPLLALPSVGRAGRSRWSPSSGRTFFRYFGGDGGSTYCGGDGGSTAFSFAVERLGSTTGDFLLRARSSSSMMLGARNAARLAARQKKKYRSGWCQLMVQLPRELARPKGGERPAALRPRNGDSASWQRQEELRRAAVAC